MGATQSIKSANYEDLQIACNSNEYIIINTINTTHQDCLVKSTLSCHKEEEILNNLMKTNKNVKIIIYGLNCNDETIYKKYHHLIKCGFIYVFIYIGGLFEWLCLQDIYGEELFPTTKKELDILKYKPVSFLNQKHITNYAYNS